MKPHVVLLFLLFLICQTSSGQIFRYRLSANAGAFLGEPGKAEIDYPMKDELSNPGSEEFSPVFKPGVELEIMAPVTPDFELGVQFGYLRVSGHTPSPPLYNFFLSRYNPLPNSYKYPDKALIFDTNLLNILGTARFYILPVKNNVNIFAKALAGVTFTGTDFTFHNPVYRVEYDVGVLYSRGTRNSDDPKTAAITGGLGLGATYRLSDKFDIYFDATALLVNSDIVNGVPNYNYINKNGQTSMERTNSPAAVAQASIGLVYSAIPDRRFNKSNFTRSSRMNKNIFHKKRKGKPFSKRRK
ncbi:hypothetical protein SAMN05444274_106305 [Mariniphaga anaerophila]|uniref:Outer membrane protein beta-barrel domain-containing protein n=1 Tax=Mariniphaga anaerophila TaxID=1484053 RepID=A0A1M5CXB4_9BACT|nr:hypothetical protein [Mariniphaga anaerophila]SHF59311.1 hypothetical protein SAMN05444274_106305 [Mariniphaga anaerophila]